MALSLRQLLGRRTPHDPAPPSAEQPGHGEDPQVDLGAATAVGGRAENQDRVRTGPDWLVVCDGVGGHAGGARAAALAVDAAAQVLAAADPDPVRIAVQAAHRAVRGGQIDPGVADMATTVTAARATDGAGRRWVVAHVGDSPAWRVADGSAVQVTVDHTVAGELLSAGTIDPSTAAHHPGRQFVTRVAGAREGVAPDVVEVDLPPGGALVVATDGVSDVLDAGRVAAMVGAATDATAAAAALVEAALAAGTRDNATVAVARRPAATGPGQAPGRDQGRGR